MSGDNQPRAWQRMLSGRRLDLLDPSPADIEISDIAHGLARVARWNGQTKGEHAFSVAQHSILVAEIFASIAPNRTPEWRLMALLHDAPEYVIGDLISPFKAVIGLDYKAVENRLLSAIHLRFGLPPTPDAAIARTIKVADRIGAYYEATVLAGFDHREAEEFFGSADTVDPHLVRQLERLEAWPTQRAQRKFLEIFEELNQQHV
ncbi:MAG: YfbR-like 5'-deoxynucleotidase [Hyphomicrobiaceae bacterium]